MNKNIFDYIFYRVFLFYRRKKDIAAETTALLVVSLIQFFLILDLFVFVRILYEYPIPSNFNKFWALFLAVPIGLYNWFKYEKNEDRIELRRRLNLKWKSENSKDKKRRGILIVLLLIITILTPILYGLIRYNIIEGKSFWIIE